jgi:hypothetical protein
MNPVYDIMKYFQSLQQICLLSLSRKWKSKNAQKIILAALEEALIRLFKSHPSGILQSRGKTIRWLETTAGNIIKEELRKELNYRKRNEPLERINPLSGEATAEWVDKFYNEEIEPKIN